MQIIIKNSDRLSQSLTNKSRASTDSFRRVKNTGVSLDFNETSLFLVFFVQLSRTKIRTNSGKTVAFNAHANLLFPCDGEK